jgi:DNA-binding NarL/FixJ family response regulator
VAIPAADESATYAVLEFHSRQRLQPSETLPRTLAGMGRELGHFLARRGGELRPGELTPREREVLQLTSQGLSNKMVARELALSPSTVKTHFENIYAKWGVSDRAAAVAKALRDGLIR